MNSFMTYGLRQAYDRFAKLGDPLAEVNALIDWERFRSTAEGLYGNKTEKGGHPNVDYVLMIKILVLQQWYSLSDQRMERELAINVSFMNFLGFPETIPDSTTIWLFRERLNEEGKIGAIWQELQRQLGAKGLTVKEGSIQMQLSLPQTREDRATSLEMTKPELVGVRTEPGLGKVRSSILALSFMTK